MTEHAAYPTWRYHETLAPAGVLVKTASEEPDGEGWVDTPAGWQEPSVHAPEKPPVVTEASRRADRLSRAVKQLYPTWRYHEQDAPEGVLVESAADEPTGPGWVDTPAAWQAEPKAEKGAQKKGKPKAEPKPTVGGPLGDEVKQAELWSASIVNILKKIDQIESPDTLRVIEELEAKNPNGPRKTVLKATQVRLKELEAFTHDD